MSCALPLPNNNWRVSMGRWLENFAFRTHIEPLVFVGAGLVVLLIATFTVSFRAIRAAQTDPVKALRHE